jgi:hypothetical protein
MNITRVVEATRILASRDWQAHQARLARLAATIETLTAPTARLLRALCWLPGDRR